MSRHEHNEWVRTTLRVNHPAVSNEAGRRVGTSQANRSSHSQSGDGSASAPSHGSYPPTVRAESATLRRGEGGAQGGQGDIPGVAEQHHGSNGQASSQRGSGGQQRGGGQRGFGQRVPSGPDLQDAFEQVPSQRPIQIGPQGPMQLSGRSLREEYGVLGPPPRLPSDAELLRMDLQALGALAHRIQASGGGIERGPALLRILRVAERNPQFNLLDGDPIWGTQDEWTQDAASYREYLLLRSPAERHSAPYQEGDQPSHPQIQPLTNQPAHRESEQTSRQSIQQPTNQPSGSLAQAVENVSGGVTAGPVGETPGVGWELGIGAIETAGHIAELIEIAGEGPGSFLTAAAGGCVGSIVGPFLTIHAGDEYVRQLRVAQRFVFNFCMAFARTIRGEPAGQGAGASAGLGAAQRTLNRLSPAQRDPALLARLSFDRFYGVAWRAIQGRVVDEIARVAEGRLLGIIPGTESSAVPNHGEIARDYILAVRLGGPVYAEFGGP